MTQGHLEHLAKAYSFATIRLAKRKAKSDKVLAMLQKIENFKLYGGVFNEYKKVDWR